MPSRPVQTASASLFADCVQTIESGFSQHKRRLGSALTARGDASQGRELVLRVLTHNLMLLAETA
jgi:transposase